jgi:hypothetical protein
MDEQQKVIAAYKDVLSADDAKAQIVIGDLSKFCLENADIFDVNSARKTDFNLGANSVIRHIRYMLKRKTEQKQETVISERKIL